MSVGCQAPRRQPKLMRSATATLPPFFVLRVLAYSGRPADYTAICNFYCAQLPYFSFIFHSVIATCTTSTPVRVLNDFRPIKCQSL